MEERFASLVGLMDRLTVSRITALGSITSYLGLMHERLRPLNTQGVPFSCACPVHRWGSMASSMSCPSLLQGARQASRWVLVTTCHTHWTMVTLCLTLSSSFGPGEVLIPRVCSFTREEEIDRDVKETFCAWILTERFH